MRVRATKEGYFLIEALLSIVIFSVLILSMFSMISFLQLRTVRSTFESDATILLQDGMEIAHAALLSNWTLYPDGVYHPAFDINKNTWVLDKDEETGLETRYNRKIELRKVCRDINTKKRISYVGTCGGFEDASLREVTTTVSWLEERETKQIDATLLVLNTND